ncbi:MAG: molybdopterin-dependent oxidoreductase [Dehalococcoidales bacterium]|nr:molybdopterin-dependent oxidoreductase [Dehalococcoidales bacterium]
MAKEKKRELIRTTTWSAGPGCHGGCGVIAHIEDGKLVKIEGDPEHPMNRGRLCSRCLSMTQYVYAKDRITSPMLRVGERGENKWKAISWDEAYDYIVEKMNKIRDEYGPESVVFPMGTGRDVGAWICMLAYAYGSPNVCFAMSGTACYTPRIVASETVLGDYCMIDGGQWLPKGHDDERYEVPECIMVWGYNIGASCPDNIFGHWIIDLMKKGTRIITVDPRLSWFASRSEKWLQLRPGTDGALAMGFLNIVIQENLYDRDFVEKWTNAPHLIRKDTGKLLRESDIINDGASESFVVWDTTAGKTAVWDSVNATFKGECGKPALEGIYKVTLTDGKEIEVTPVWEEFSAEAAKYPVDKVAEITWLKEEDIIEAARLYARSKPAIIQWGLAIDSTPGISPAATAITALWCITGNVDRPGGNVIAKYAYNAVAYALPGAKGVIKQKSKEIDEKRIGYKEFGPFRQFVWRAHTDMMLDQIFSGDPYPVKGMFLQACNIVGGTAYDPMRWIEAMKKLDFVAVIDLFMTPTCQMADIVLPAVSFLEKDSIRSWWTPLQTINKALEPIGDTKSLIQIDFDLAKRFDPEFRWNDIYELFDEILEPSGMNFKELQEKGWSIPPEGDPSAPYKRFEKGLLRQDGQPGFNTQSGKIEIYSTLREDWGLEPIPHYEEPPITPVSRPDLFEKYPLILSTGRRSPVFFNSEHRNIPWLREIDPDPNVEIHPDTAKEYGIGNGEWVCIENWMGKCRMKAKVSPIVPRWMVMAAHAWWYPEGEGNEEELYGLRDVNINKIMPMGFYGKDGLGTITKQLMCKIYKDEPKEVQQNG